MAMFRSTSEMKDSGFDVIANIPREWNVRRIKYVLNERNERVDDADPKDLLSVSEYYGVAPRAEKIKSDATLMRSETLEGYKICKRDDLVVNIMLAWKGALGVSKYEGVVSPSYCVYSPICDDVVMKYLHYLFTTDSYKTYFRHHSTGIIDSRLRLYTDEFFSLWCVLPPLSEQQVIADYLDDQCSKIDEIIAEATESIEEYKELKQAVIFETVTKGLDKNTPMKDSGIEWIGKIPVNWKMGKIKNGVTKVGSGKTPKGGAEVYSTEGVLFLRSQNIYDEGLKLDNPFFISEDIDEEMKNTRVQPHDVLLNITGGSIGRCCVVPDSLGRANVNQHVSIIRAIKSVFLPEYLHMFWISPLGKIAIALYQTGGNREGMSAEAIKNTPIQIPPLGEQEQIIKTLEPTLDKFDALISEKQALIDDLQAYKKSLIYEVVTGKRKVV